MRPARVAPRGSAKSKAYAVRGIAGCRLERLKRGPSPVAVRFWALARLNLLAERCVGRRARPIFVRSDESGRSES